MSTWMGWSAKHKWVSRANARDAWLTRVSDEQIDRREPEGVQTGADDAGA